MLNYILYNNFFITTLSYLILINIILTGFTKTKESTASQKNTTNEIEIYKNKIIDFFILILILILFLIFIKQKDLYSFFVFITIILSFIRIFKNYTKDSLHLNYQSKQNYIYATCIFTILFSSKAYQIYYNSFSFIPHYLKEILLLIFLIIKIVFIIFFILINISIIISNIQILYGKNFSTMITKLKNISWLYIPKYYKFHFSVKEKTKLTLFIDKTIFFITCPFFMIFNIIYKTLLTLIVKSINILIWLYRFLLNYNNNRNLIIKNIIKIALIFSFVIVYILVIYENKIFSNEIKDIYNLIITVLLIPIIYDSIKSK